MASPDKQLLLVEDEEAVCVLWEEILEEWGYTFHIARSGSEALENARQSRYELMLVDLGLPDLSGEELIRILKTEQPEVAVIVVTGKNSVETAVELMRGGVYDFIPKPINFVRAEISLQNCLSERSARRETESLRRTTDVLTELNERKERFLAITGHELRTPVGLLKNAVDVLSKEMRGGESDFLIDIISQSSDRLVEIVQQMHEVSRWQSNGSHIYPTRFSLGDMCRGVIHELGMVVQERRQTLNIEIDDQLFLTADRVKFKKVFRELVENAIKYTEDNGTISVSGESNAADQVRLSVSDNGIGISEEHRDRIFDLFYEAAIPQNRGPTRKTRLGSGMGIGLAIVHEIVAAHQGLIQVSSEVGKGSRFTVTLPRTGPNWLESTS